ncbi:MAG: hypothetical protein EAS52_13250 [Parapedobacter sp.]|nr:MAG: hypothetical protein EAS52_13250 [Parapedobacter sp.]
MWDGLTASLRDDEAWNRISNSLILDFDDTIRYGELLFSKADYDKQIRFTLNHKRKEVHLSFSPHKLYNALHGVANYSGRAMNHDTFTPSKLKWVFRWLEETFSIMAEKCILHSLEFGCNLTDLDIQTEFVLSKLIVYKNKRFNEMRELVGLGNGFDVEFGQFRLKIYDKALQNRLQYSILRIELKAIKGQAIKNIFGKTAYLSDLVNTHYWLLCRDKLLQTLHFCLFDDVFDIELLDSQQIELLRWRNSKTWENPKGDIDKPRLTGKQRQRAKEKFDAFILQNGRYKIKQAIHQNIEKEITKMLSPDTADVIKLPLN